MRRPHVGDGPPARVRAEPDRGGARAGDRLLDSARWSVFAVAADDARRRRYAAWLQRFRAGDVAERQKEMAALGTALAQLDPAVAFATVGPDGFPPAVEAADEARALAAGLPSAEGRDTGKPYLHDFPLDLIAGDSAIARLALHEGVVSTAARYLGQVPVLAAVTVLRSPFVAGAPTGSQLFHSDWEDVTQVKVFVHCTDVTPGHGPLTAVRADASADVRRVLRYRYGGSGFRRRDDEVLPLVGPGDVSAFKGPPGTSVFVDTSRCLHFGSRVEEGVGDRLVLQLQYLRSTAFDLLLRRAPLPRIGAPWKPSHRWQQLVVPGPATSAGD